MTDTDPHPWCCARSLGFASECPLCPQYGTNAADRCPGHGLNDANQAVIETARLHAEHRHPGYEYRVTVGPRKQWDDIDRPPAGEDGEPDPSWERNVDAGRPGQGWDRFNYTEESYWRRKKQPPHRLGGAESGQETPARGEDPQGVVSGAQAAAEATGWTQLEARAFNAVLPALRQAGEWLPLSARRAVANAVLAELKPDMDALNNRAVGTWGMLKLMEQERDDWGDRHHAIADRLDRARQLHRENCLLATGKVKPTAFTCGMCDALDPQTATQATAGHDDGPSVRDCAEADRSWDLEKAGE